MRIIHLVFLGVVFVLVLGVLPMAKSMLFTIIKNGYFWLGAIAFFAIYRLWLKKHIGFLQTLDHELSHMIVSLLFGNKMLEMYVHDRMGGHVKYHGRGRVLISLAPYFLRMPMLLMILLSLFVSANRSIIRTFYVLLGISLCYAYVSIIEEAKPYQTDLQQNGLIFSYIMVLGLNIIWFAIMMSIVLPRFELLDLVKNFTWFLK